MACVAASLLVFCSSAPHANASSSSTWTLDAALVSQLDPATAISTIGSIQPPKGYTLDQKVSPDGSGSVYSWTGPAGVKGYTPTLSVIVAIPPKDADPTNNIDIVMANLVANFKTNKRNWKLSPVSIGNVSGLSFHRVDWSGLDDNKKLNIQGSVFGTQLQNGWYLIFVAEDAEPGSKTSLPLMTDSVLTFQQNSR